MRREKERLLDILETMKNMPMREKTRLRQMACPNLGCSSYNDYR